MNAKDFVFAAVRPSTQGSMGSSLERPERVSDSDFWMDVKRQAQALGVSLPVLLACDRAYWADELALSVRGSMTETIERAELLSALAENDLQVILSQLSQNSIPAIVLGDVDLRRRFYLERIYKHVQTLELMVTQEDFSRALRILGHLGYRLMDSYVEGRTFVSLSRKLEAPLLILRRDLQTGLPHQEMQTASIWDRSVPTEQKDFPHESRFLSTEDALIHAFLRFDPKNRRTSLIHFLDLYALLSTFSGRLGQRELAYLSVAQVLQPAAVVVKLLEDDWGMDLHQDFRSGIESRVDPVRRQALSGISTIHDWFEEQFDRGRIRRIRSRWLLGESLIHAVRGEWQPRRAPLSLDILRGD